MAFYEITDEGTFTKVLQKEGPNVLSYWAIPRSVSILVRDGYLFMYFGKKLIIPAIPRALISIPASVDDESLFNALSFMSEAASGGGSVGNFKYYSNPLTFHTLQGDISPNIGQGSQGITLVAQLIKPLGSFQVNSITINIISGVVGTAVVGIYSIDANGYPSSKLIQTTEFNTAITGVQTIAVSGLTLNGGENYAAVFQCSAPIPNMRRFGYLSTNTGLIWGTDAVSAKYGLLNIANVYNPTLPNTFPAGAALNAQPLIGIYFQ